jgi:uncharacterized protein (DUF58 family)
VKTNPRRGAASVVPEFSLFYKVVRSRAYLCLLILCLFFIIFERPIGIVALSVNHMIRNLDRALLYSFSNVSVEIALWSHVFLGSDNEMVFHVENRLFPRICVTEHSGP